MIVKCWFIIKFIGVDFKSKDGQKKINKRKITWERQFWNWIKTKFKKKQLLDLDLPQWVRIVLMPEPYQSNGFYKRMMMVNQWVN